MKGGPELFFQRKDIWSGRTHTHTQATPEKPQSRAGEAQWCGSCNLCPAQDILGHYVPSDKKGEKCDGSDGPEPQRVFPATRNRWMGERLRCVLGPLPLVMESFTEEKMGGDIVPSTKEASTRQLRTFLSVRNPFMPQRRRRHSLSSLSSLRSIKMA